MWFLNDSLKPFWTFRKDKHVVNNLIFKNNCQFIPKILRPELLKVIHEGHLSQERSKNQIRDLIFWLNIYYDIKNIVESCEVCMKYRNNNSKELLITHDIPQLPWYKLGMDLFHFDNKTYLLVVDYFSKYIDIAHLTSGFNSKQ